MPTSTGLFVTIEGPNGCGKSTVVAALHERLTVHGIQILTTKEPTDSFLGRFARQSESTCDGRALACLVAADRYYRLDKEIAPALGDGKAVISDRYVESSLVLQVLDGVEREFVWAINSSVFVPDLSVHLTASPQVLHARLQERSTKSRFEKMEVPARELALYAAARDFLAHHGFRFLVVDNEAESPETVADRICEALARKVNTMRAYR